MYSLVSRTHWERGGIMNVQFVVVLSVCNVRYLVVLLQSAMHCKRGGIINVQCVVVLLQRIASVVVLSA